MGQFTVPVAAETRRVASRQNRFNTPAIRSVMESLRIAASNGYVRLYLDEGAELENLLRPRGRQAAEPHTGSFTRAHAAACRGRRICTPKRSACGSRAADGARTT